MESQHSLGDDDLAAAVSAIRSYDSVVVVGAGMSAFGYPLTRDLPAILWQAIDSAPEAIEVLRAQTGSRGSAKQIMQSTNVDPQMAWDLLRQVPDARSAFQTAFSALDADREPSQAHIDLARLIRSGRVQCVISYNWDTCLERAYASTFGVQISNDVLFKPHGDAASPNGFWIFPDETGSVPDEIVRRVNEFSNRPRTLMVVGYSGSDEVVVEKLLEPLSSQWPVVRIGPEATGEGALATRADVALAEIAASLGSATQPASWRYVTFNRRRDFGAALRGERLRPSDVYACPELPAAARLAMRLQVSKFATVSGPSGSGKSITAFHAAKRLNSDGWAVVELAQDRIPSHHAVSEFLAIPGPVVAVVDDAQAVSSDFLEELRDSVTDDHAVLLVSTIRLEARSDETLIASQAQEVLYRYCAEHIDEVGTLISALDDRVRKSAFASETPKARIELARRSTTEPWLFMFVASGGERRISNALDRLVETPTTAATLAGICIAQMTTRDGGLTRLELLAWLEDNAQEVFEPQRRTANEEFLSETINTLISERLVVEREGRLRGAHIRIADHALRALGLRSEHGIGESVLTWTRDALLAPDIPLSGKFWLFRTFDRYESYRTGPIYRIIDNDVLTALITQLETAPNGLERGAGLNLLWSVDFVRKMSDELADRAADCLLSWLPDISEDEVNGFRWMTSGLRSSHEASYKRVTAAVSPSKLAASLSTNGTRARASDWADLLREFEPRWDDPGRESWVEKFRDGIDADALSAWLKDLEPESRSFETYELISALAELSPSVAKLALDACAANIVDTFETDLLDAGSNFHSWVFGIMFVIAAFADSPSSDDDDDDDDDESINDPSSTQGDSTDPLETADYELQLRDLSGSVLELMESIDWEKSAASLVGKERYEMDSLDILLVWIGKLSAPILDRIALALPLDWLYSMTAAEADGDRERKPSFVDGVLIPLAGTAESRKIAEGFLANHDEDFKVFPVRLIRYFPNVAVHFMNTGRQLEVRSDSVRWTELQHALTELAKTDLPSAKHYLSSLSDSMRANLTKPIPGQLQGIRGFISAADAIEPRVMSDVLKSLLREEVEAGWRSLLQRAPEDLEPLLKRSVEAEGELAEFARALQAESLAASSKD